MGTGPVEDPPIKPGQPTEPPPESPPGNPKQPDVPPPMREPGAPPRPEELPGQTPEELPVRGPPGPTAPNPAVADLPGSQGDVNPDLSASPQGTM
jgi:hypothetical protein